MGLMEYGGRHCRQCGGELKQDARFCPTCGAATPLQVVGYCTNCGAQLLEGQASCFTCGCLAGSLRPEQPAEPNQAAPQKEKKNTGLFVGILAVLLVAIMAVAVILLFQPKEAESVELDRGQLSMMPGQRIALDYEVLPENTPDKSVTWKSSNDAVAVVKNGEVVAVGQGRCTITVSTENGMQDTCVVQVDAVQVQELVLSETQLTLHVGDTAQLTCQVLPEDASTSLEWTLDQPDVLTVDQGSVTAQALGRCVVTVTADNGVSASCTVEVTAREEETLPLGSWSLVLIEDRYEDTGRSAEGCTLVLEQGLTGTMTQGETVQSFTWHYDLTDVDGDRWYDVQGLEDVQLVYCSDGTLQLYMTDDTWVFTKDSP